MKTRRRTRMTLTVLAIALPATTALASCDSTDEDEEARTVTIEVETSDWTGWDPDHQPRPETTVVEATQGTTFEAMSPDGVEFEVVDLENGKVSLETSSSLSPRSEDGGIDLNGARDEFTLTREEPLRLSTPTTDAGDHITLTLQ